MVDRSKYEYDRAWRKAHPWITHYYSARQRCTDPKHPSFKRYGGRGIKVLFTLAEVKALWERDGAALRRG